MDKIEVTQDDKDAAASLMSDVGLFSNVLTAKAVQAFAAHRLATRTDATPVADSDETFLTAYVSANTNIIGIDHPTEAPWQQVYDAHLALRDRLNERLEQEDLRPYKPEAGTNTHPPATDVAALVEAAKDLRDAIAHMAAPARVDPDKYFSEQVKAFGDAFGYGALMTTASALWRQDLGDLQGGEFAVGPCVTTAANQLKRLSAALTPFTKGQNDD